MHMISKLFYGLLILALVADPVESDTGSDHACDVRASLEMAAVHLSVGQPDAALRSLSCVMEAAPENPWLWYYTGAANLQLGNAYVALTNLNRASQLIRQSGTLDAGLTGDVGLTERINMLHRRARR